MRNRKRRKLTHPSAVWNWGFRGDAAVEARIAMTVMEWQVIWSTMSSGRGVGEEAEI